MKRAGLLSAGALAALLGAVACSASSPQDTYWDGYAQGETIDTAPDPDPDCGKGIDPKDVAAYINACASWPKDSDAECGAMLPDDVDSVVWMAGCNDGAQGTPNHSAYGPRPK